MYTGGPAAATFTQIREKSGSTNLPEGVVHIYRTLPESQSQTPQPPTATSSSSSGLSSSKLTAGTGDDPEASVLLAVLAVPAWMTPSDFLAFIAPAADGMAHLRMIRWALFVVCTYDIRMTEIYDARRDSAPNRSIVVIAFRDQAEASEFAEVYNGKPFNSMEVRPL